MQPFFTIHAAEYLVGSHIEQHFKNINIWVPAKDKGIDLLLTNSDNSKSVSIQVKFSRDFLITVDNKSMYDGLQSTGWWALNKNKLSKSVADFWVFVIHSFKHKELQFIIINPKELMDKYKFLGRNKATINTYFTITEKGKVFETRRLKKKDRILIANNAFKNAERDFTKYLNNWSCITDKLN